MKNSDVIREVVDAFNAGDLETVWSRLHPDIDWALAEGHPYSPAAVSALAGVSCGLLCATP